MAALPPAIRNHRELAELSDNPKFRKRVFGRARREGWSSDRAEDLLQEVLLIILRKLNKGQHIERLDRFLARTIRYCVYSANRRAERWRRVGANVGSHFDPPAPAGVALDAVAQREHLRRIGEAMHLVDERARTAIVLRFQEHLTLKRIAEILDISVAGAHRTVSLGLIQLRDHVAA